MITIAKNSKFATKLATGVAAFGVLATVGMTNAPAQAVLGGSAGVSGAASFLNDPFNTTIQFNSANIDFLDGLFSGATVASNPVSILLGAPDPGGIYDIPFVDDFITFNLSGGGTVTGDLLPSLNAIRRNPAIGANFQYQTIVPSLSIVFTGPGTEAVNGTLFLNGSRSGTASNYQITLERPDAGVEIPEPSTMLGIGTIAALGLSAGLKRKKIAQA